MTATPGARCHLDGTPATSHVHELAIPVCDRHAATLAAEGLQLLPLRFADAQRAKSHGGLVHTCNPGVPSGLPFGRKDDASCARCWEMVHLGAQARRPEWTEQLGRRARADEQRREEIRAHFAPGGPHARGTCGPVCTAFDW